MDLGECYTKIGNASEDVPRCIIPSRYASTSDVFVMCGAEGSKTDSRQEVKPENFFGYHADRRTGLMPVYSFHNEHRDIERADVLGKFIHNTMVEYFDSSETTNQEILILDKHNTNIKVIKEVAEVMFDWNKFERFLIMPDSIASLYSTGRSTGVVVSCGYNSTSVSSILNGDLTPLSCTSTNSISSRIVTTRYKHLINDIYYERKRKGLGVSTAPLDREVRAFVENNAIVSPDSGSSGTNHTVTLPDGQSFDTDIRDLTDPFSQYFSSKTPAHDNDSSIVSLLSRSVDSTTAYYRDSLLSNIVVEGGISKSHNFINRLQEDIRDRYGQYKCKIYSHSDPLIVPYQGACRLKDWLDDNKMWFDLKSLREEGIERSLRDVHKIY